MYSKHLEGSQKLEGKPRRDTTSCQSKWVVPSPVVSMISVKVSLQTRSYGIMVGFRRWAHWWRERKNSRMERGLGVCKTGLMSPLRITTVSCGSAPHKIYGDWGHCWESISAIYGAAKNRRAGLPWLLHVRVMTLYHGQHCVPWTSSWSRSWATVMRDAHAPPSCPTIG